MGTVVGQIEVLLLEVGSTGRPTKYFTIINVKEVSAVGKSSVKVGWPQGEPPQESFIGKAARSLWVQREFLAELRARTRRSGPSTSTSITGIRY